MGEGGGGGGYKGMKARHACAFRESGFRSETAYGVERLKGLPEFYAELKPKVGM